MIYYFQIGNKKEHNLIIRVMRNHMRHPLSLYIYIYIYIYIYMGGLFYLRLLLYLFVLLPTENMVFWVSFTLKPVNKKQNFTLVDMKIFY